MKNDHLIHATVKKLGINGEGIAYLDKKITFIQGALPDEEVKIELVRSEPKYKVGKLVEVKKASPYRVNAKCRYQKDCLGCPLMVLEYQKQLENKAQLLRDTFNKYAHDAFSQTHFDGVMPAPQQSSIRQIVRLPVVNFNDKVTFGIYQRESKYLTLMTGCMMHSKQINNCLVKLEEIFADLHLQAYDELKHKGIRFLTIREFDEGLQLIFVTGLDRLPDRAIEAISQIKEVQSLYLTVNTTRKQDFEMQRYELKYGNSRMKQIFMQKEFSVSSKADFPVYRQHALRCAKQISKLIDEKNGVKRIIDVGCGIGLYSLGLDEKYEIHGIDVSKININDAIKNVEIQNRTNAIYEEGRIDSLFTTLSKKARFDVALLQIDHFRMTEDMIESILASKTPHLILFGDHVSMMAKQVADLQEQYQLTDIIALDGQPNGAGMSVIACLDRK